VEKADLNKGYQNPKKGEGVATHLNLERKCHTFLVFKSVFRITVAKLSLKNVWLPTFFFLDSSNPC